MGLRWGRTCACLALGCKHSNCKSTVCVALINFPFGKVTDMFKLPIVRKFSAPCTKCDVAPESNTIPFPSVFDASLILHRWWSLLQKIFFVKCFDCGVMLLQFGKCRFALLFLNIVIIVVIVVKWGPVICMVKVCINWFYFTVLHFCCYWKPHAPSTWLDRLPIGRLFGSICFQLPTLTFGTIGVYFVAKFTFIAFLHFSIHAFCLAATRSDLLFAINVAAGVAVAADKSLTQQFDQFGHIVIICFNNCFQLLDVLCGKILNYFFCCGCVFFHHVMCWHMSCCPCRYWILAVCFCIFSAHQIL